jgi:argininosuccinate lyase
MAETTGSSASPQKDNPHFLQLAQDDNSSGDTSSLMEFG